MSRELPRRPSLEHLKKQAKHLLRDLQRMQPGATLTDAQHTLARQYGFESWPKLRAHVEAAASAAARQPSFHRFTEKARHALFYARLDAAETGAALIEPVHLLLGVLRVGKDMPGHVLAASQASVDGLRSQLNPQIAVPHALRTHIPFSNTTQRVVSAAIDEADSLGHDGIGLTHLALGILSDTDSPAARRLIDAGIHPTLLRQTEGDD